MARGLVGFAATGAMSSVGWAGGRHGADAVGGERFCWGERKEWEDFLMRVRGWRTTMSGGVKAFK